MIVRNKSIFKIYFYLKMLRLAKIWVHNNASSSEKMVFSEPREKYAQTKQRLHDKTDILVDFDVRE